MPTAILQPPAISIDHTEPGARNHFNTTTGANMSLTAETTSASSLQSPPIPGQPTKVRRQRPDTEEIKRVGRIHYQELLTFLRSHLAKEQTGPRSNAREKLTRLSKQQFTELSTDVYDELMRRINNARRNSAQPHLAVRDEFHPKRNQARQKLATLPKTRFKDLSSDVFFELERRFPELKQEFRPDAIAREKQLAQEESERKERELQELQKPPPSAQESTSDVVIPNKSTLVDEDIAVPYRSSPRIGHETDEDEFEGRSARESVDNRSTMYSQASSLGTGFLNGYAGSRAATTAGSVASPNLDRGSSHADAFPSVFGIEKLKSDYEFRIATLQQRITALEAQNAQLEEHTSRGGDTAEHQKRLQEVIDERDRLRDEHQDEVRHWQNELGEQRQRHDAKHRELQDTLARLDEVQRDMDNLQLNGGGGGGGAGELERLQSDYAEQEQLMQDLRSEIESLVQEVQQLSTRNEELVSEKDQDLVVIRDLTQQVQTFKRKYEHAKTELRQYKATSQLYVQPPKADEFMPPSPTGVISDVNVTAFQSSIDDLISAARSTTPSSTLIAMKSVVLATTLITDDVAKFEQSPQSQQLSPDDADTLLQLKPRISTTLNSLMTACRNHASSHGMSPVSLLDAAASHVSTTVVDLVKLLKVRSATQPEKEQFEAHFAAGGNGLPPNGLKPLHIGSLAASGKSPTFSPTLDSAEWKARSSGERLNPIDTSAERLSPRAVKSAATSTPTASSYGRYSPVGYRPNVARKDSAGSWKAGRDMANGIEGHAHNLASRAVSGSSSSSINGHMNGPVISSVPALPRTDMKTVKHQWSSPPRRRTSGAARRRSGPSSDDQQDGGNGGLSTSSSSDGLHMNGHVNGASDVAPLPLPRSMNSQDSGLSHGSQALNGTHASLGNGNDNDNNNNGGRSLDDSSEENWAELQNYIEVQTEAIVHCIQALLSAIREGAQGVQLNENLVQITTIASSIVAISRDNLPEDSRTEGENILEELTDNCERLSEMQAHPTFDKSTKSAMASASYGVAKGLKALNVLLNSSRNGGDFDGEDGEIDLS